MTKNIKESAKKLYDHSKQKKQKEENVSLKQRLFPNGFKEFVQGDTLRFLFGLLCLITALIMLLAFTSHFFTGFEEQAEFESEHFDTPKNYGGVLGSYMANYFMNQCFGVCAYFIPIFLIALGLKMMKAYKVRLWKWFLNCSILMIWGSITLCLIQSSIFNNATIGHETFYLGGLHGRTALDFLKKAIGVGGTFIVVIATAICYLVYVSNETINVVRKMLKPQDFIKSHLPKRKLNEGKEENEEDSEETTKEEMADEVPDMVTTEEPTEEEHSLTEEANRKFEDEIPVSLDLSNKEVDDKEPALILEEKPEEMVIEHEPLEVEPAQPKPTPSSATELTIDKQIVEETASGKTLEDMSHLEPYDPRKDLEYYKFPSLNLLKKYADNGPAVDMAEQNANKDRIITVLKSFGVEISSIKATIGPTITLYEITPAQGVRINKIRNLEDDIALSLSALGIRIIAPIPGKGTIGIEVPNKKPRIVSMESILNSKKFQESTFELPIALGKTITNEVFMVDLAKMPHLLVAGATGQGKSVGLNAIITSLLYKKHPAELKFVMVDPKKVEFSIYSPIENHFLAKIPDGDDPIITDVTKVVQTLKSLCELMDHRYDLLKKAKVRNIKEYNAKFKERKLNPEHGHAFMPYIVVIIDEFGDLIMTAGKEVELPIARIAQLARAVGMHMVIATQRPTTNIITGTIKANFPARMAFKVMSRIDSQTILDRTGANQLVGKGDMLFLCGNDPVRVQCAFVDTPEVEQINNHIAEQQGYLSAFELPEVLSDSEGNGGNEDFDTGKLDPLFEQAARLIVIHQQGSTSLIQRKFAIGYNRAGRLMDQLEQVGIVGPTRGAKPREVLCADEMELDNKLSGL